MERRSANAVKRALVCMAVLLATSSCTEHTAPPLAACPTGLRPIPPVPAPRLPVGESLPSAGTAQVRFVIDRSGGVHSPIIVADALRPVGRPRNVVTGYHEMIVATVAQFRYPARATPCRMEMPFEIGFDDADEEAPSIETSGNP